MGHGRLAAVPVPAEDRARAGQRAEATRGFGAEDHLCQPLLERDLAGRGARPGGDRRLQQARDGGEVPDQPQQGPGRVNHRGAPCAPTRVKNQPLRHSRRRGGVAAHPSAALAVIAHQHAQGQVQRNAGCGEHQWRSRLGVAMDQDLRRRHRQPGVACLGMVDPREDRHALVQLADHGAAASDAVAVSGRPVSVARTSPLRTTEADRSGQSPQGGWRSKNRRFEVQGSASPGHLGDERFRPNESHAGRQGSDGSWPDSAVGSPFEGRRQPSAAADNPSRPLAVSGRTSARDNPCQQ
ncbi:hypothetical protein CBM2599_B51226 [Cupriavidus taiwanensis]|nr:hypothetical protein CBM2599_B51226 [Cupriavidus taiwanensis]SOZ00210.1 hypothetical protein CBM2600_B70236 [Cupriavidus taiwanensis]